MPLRTKVHEFTECCDGVIKVLKDRPDLLTHKERLDLEVGITRIMSALVHADQTRQKGQGER
jgi:hypothetical protein